MRVESWESLGDTGDTWHFSATIQKCLRSVTYLFCVTMYKRLANV